MYIENVLLLISEKGLHKCKSLSAFIDPLAFNLLLSIQGRNGKSRITHAYIILICNTKTRQVVDLMRSFNSYPSVLKIDSGWNSAKEEHSSFI